MQTRTALKQALQAKNELLRRRAWEDFYIFAKYVCGNPDMEEVPHREMCEFAVHGLGESPQLNIGVTPVVSLPSVKAYEGKLHKLQMHPRSTFKSSVITKCLPLWLLWHNPNLRIMIDSEVLGNAKKYLAAIKELIADSPIIKEICVDSEGNFVLEPNTKVPGGWTEDQIILASRTKLGMKEPTIFCAGVDVARTGMHPDVIIGDDLVSDGNVNTKEQIEKVKNHYKYSLSLLEPNGLLLIIGTRYHMADLYGELMENEGFDKLIRPAWNADGSLYFPTRLTEAYLESLKKAQEPYIFNCQYMLNPIDDSTAVFKKSYMQYWDKLPPLVAKYILIDLAISQKETADYTVIMCVGVTADKRIYVIEYDRGRFEYKEIIENIFKMYNRHKGSGNVRAVGIETVQFQKVMLHLLRDEMRRRGTHMPLKELKADKDKKRRIGALEPYFANGDVYMRREHVELEAELLEFPLSKHDDSCDCLAYILQVMKPGYYTQADAGRRAYIPRSSITGY